MFKRKVLELNRKERVHNWHDHNTGQAGYGNNKKVPLDKHCHTIYKTERKNFASWHSFEGKHSVKF